MRGYIEQQYCKAMRLSEKRYSKFSASNEIVVSVYWGASLLGYRSMGQENLQIILATEPRQKSHPERYLNLPQQGSYTFSILTTIVGCRETIGRRRTPALQDSSRNSL